MIRFVVSWLLDPLNQFLLVFLVGALLRKRRPKTAGFLFYYAAAWFFLTTISPVPIWLTKAREGRFPVWEAVHFPVSDAAGVHVLVLGAGHTLSPGLPPNDQLSATALGRLVEGLRIYRLLPGSKLIGSGYSSTGRTPQAEILAQTALVLGMPPRDTLQLPTPSNTEAEARAYSARFGSDHLLILVTDAVHMPRAMFWFRQMGLRPIPAPTNHQVKPDPEDRPFPFKPSIRKMEMVDKLLHEYVGMWYAKSRWWVAGNR